MYVFTRRSLFEIVKFHMFENNGYGIDSTGLGTQNITK